MSNGPIPWNTLGFSSALLYPLPFLVIACMNTGPSNSFATSSVSQSSFMLWPSTGPKYLNPSSSNMIPSIIAYLTVFLRCCRPVTMPSPISGTLETFFFILAFIAMYLREPLSFLKYFDIPPVLWDIDIPLSFSITIIFVSRVPALFSASNASPPVIAPSPMTETTL